MEEKKRDLIPVAAIAVFLVIIVILCLIRLGDRKKESATGSSLPQESLLDGGTESGGMTLSNEESEFGIQKETESTSDDLSRKEEETETTKSSHNLLPFGQTEQPQPETGQEQTGQEQTAQLQPGGNSVSASDPFAGAEGVHKTNEEMLIEMSGYWEQRNMDAVEELAELAWFRRMSASIGDLGTFYYYGERNEQGQPNGIGIAVYAGNEYYYGNWVNGKREGQGEWLKKYVYYDNDANSDRAYSLHMYMGEWANDKPNGEGQEHYDLDMQLASKQDRYLQNVIGTFQDGLYSGEMYLTTLNWDGNQEEWNGFADGGIWSPYGSGTNKKEIPVCVDVDDDANFLWIAVRENRDRGITELLP